MRYLVHLGLFCLVFLGIFSNLRAQFRLGVVDLEAVLKKMPAYLNVNAQIEKLSRGWEAELKKKELELKKKQQSFAVDEPFFTGSMKSVKQAEIEKLERELLSLNKRYFGFEGLYFKKKQELLKPLQDKIYEVIERIAQNKRLDLVLDRSASGSLILYVEPKLDITLRVIQILGL